MPDKEEIEPDDFDRWTEIKKRIQSRKDTKKFFPKERQVWMVSLGKNIGNEQNGSPDTFMRPILIVKKFNNKMFWAVPLSSKQKPYDFYYNFTDPMDNKAALILAQMRLLSIERCERFMYRLPSESFVKILHKLRAYLE